MGSLCNTGRNQNTRMHRTTSLPLLTSDLSTPTKFIKQQFSNFLLDYEVEPETIGVGLYGIVKKCVHKRSGLHYAVKEIMKSGLPPSFLRNKTLQKQIEILKELDHPCVLRIHEFYEDKTMFYIVMDFYSGGDLIEKVISQGKLQESECVVIFWQVCSAISYLHSKNIVHRDIKPENIVLEDNDKSMSVKIIDFDTAVHCTQPLHDMVGTLDYMAPEVLDGKYTEKADMWSLGVLLYVLLSGNSPFGASTDQLLRLNIKRGKYDLVSKEWKEISPQAKDLLKLLLTTDPDSRLSASAALQHPWVQSSDIGSHDLVSTLLRVKDFSNKNKFQEVIYTYILSHIIPHEQLKTLKLIFQQLDYNADGKLSKNEILYVLREEMEIERATEAVEIIFNNGDSDKNGYLEYSEFLRAAIERENLLSDENIEKTFKMIDSSGDGIVTYAEFQDSFGSDLPASVISELLLLIDPNKTGKILFSQFRDFLREI